MSVREALLSRARDYELRAASCAERAEMGVEGERQAAVGFAVVAVALREVVCALDESSDWSEAA